MVESAGLPHMRVEHPLQLVKCIPPTNVMHHRHRIRSRGVPQVAHPPVRMVVIAGIQPEARVGAGKQIAVDCGRVHRLVNGEHVCVPFRGWFRLGRHFGGLPLLETHAAAPGGHAEEVLQEPMPVETTDGFWVKLHPPLW